MRRSTVVLAGLGAGAAAAAAFYWRSGQQDPSSALSSSSRAARSMELARIGTSAATDLAVHRAKRALATTEEKKEQLDAEYQLRTAEQVAEVLGGMKGALMKVGQMASFLDQGLPEPVRDALAQLQADAPPMAPELAREVVERELGRPVSTLFRDWEDVPMAAASIGQVHRAVTTDGRAVAVKVQYPGVDEAIAADLANGQLLIQAIGFVFPGMEPGPIVAELRDRLTEELDYEREGRDQQAFADYYDGHPAIHVPSVVATHTTRRVLTTELAPGVRFAELESWSQDEQDLAGEVIYRFVFRSLWRMHMFNGDPHPGNYLFEPGGRVTFLDFGLVKRFAAGELTPLHHMLQAAVVDHDREALRRGAVEAGFLSEGTAVDVDALYDYLSHFYEFVSADEPMTITPEWSSEAVRRYFDQSGGHAEIQRVLNVPGPLVLMQRINLGLIGVLGQLHATRNWRRIAGELWPWVDGAPSTPLGEAEAAWLAEQGHPAVLPY